MRIAALVMLGLFAGAVSAEDDVPQALPPEQEVPALLAAERTGLAIYRHDHAAAVATDVGFAVPGFKTDKRINGWITEEQQGSIVVTFVDATPAALYRVTVKDGVAGPLVTLEAPTPLTPYEAGAAAARSAALAGKFEPCSDRYNSVVLPSPVAGQWAVYLLAGTTRENVVPIGGTYRMEVSGSKVVSQRGFTITCIALENNAPADQGKVAAMFITHLLDPIPTEAHVFWSTWAKQPLYVATPPHGTIWGIEGGRIKLIERDGAKD